MTPEPLLWLDSLQGSGIRPGLTRMRALLRELGNPERACPSIIVAGTNGKGSTSSTLASILNASGYRTGLYTSPHLVELRERWMIGGSMISAEQLVSAIEQRLAEAEADFRRRLADLAADGEAERGVIEARLHELARRVDQALAYAQERVSTLESSR